MVRAVLGRLLIGLVCGGAMIGAAAAEEPIDESLRALQREVQSDLDGLRQAVDRARGMKPAPPGPTSATPGSASPGMTAPPAGGVKNTPAPSPGMAAPAARGPSAPAAKKSAAPLVARVAGPLGKSTHWALQPIVAPPLPAVRDATWCRDDLDRFVIAALEAQALRPNPDAAPAVLARRAAYDLTGLPPARADVELLEAAAAESPADLQKHYDELLHKNLASPRYGERWARHWLDVVHYADSIGQIWNAPFTYAWRYRDWVIDAFNADKPYDRFVIEQIAGDLLDAPTAEERRALVIAGGMLALGSLDLVDGQVEAFQLDRVDDQVDVTTRGLLGLTVSCARCHDHKYDPITTRDYYALAGIFYSSRTLSGTGEPDSRRNGYVDPEMLAELPRTDAEPRAYRSLSAVVPSARSGLHSMNDFQDEWRRGYRDLRYTTDPDLAMAVTERTPRDCPVRIKGEPYDYGETPPRGDLRIAGLPHFPAIPADESGRRELAEWLTSPHNPLAARVIVNRVWQHLFGRGLVRTVDDFGSTGDRPTHPELLDHLAARFMADGWSIKKLVRTIMLSRTYQLSSAGDAAAEAIDPANDFFWRANLRRLEWEPVRDTMLEVAGRLSSERPEGIQVAGIGGKGKWGGTRSLLTIDAPYRTIYLPVLRSLLPAEYATFDFPDPIQILGRREVTTVAPQGLFFLNGDFSLDCATGGAEAVLREAGVGPSERVRAAYWRVLARAPTDDEIAEAAAFVDGLQPPSSARDAQRYRWTALVQALLAGAEFRYVP